ncbi:hypothetical protein GCM10009616_02680 [Microlunatus lacustris]
MWTPAATEASSVTWEQGADVGAVHATGHLGDRLVEALGVPGSEVDGPAEGGQAGDGLQAEALVGPGDEGDG